MKNKKIIYFIWILILFFTIISVYSQWNWIQTTIWNKFWIWSPNKNTNQTPNLVISDNNKIGLWLSDISSLDSSDFRSWDVVANRYCFENSKECVTTFQQWFTNVDIYNPVLPSDLLSSWLVTDIDGKSITPKTWESFFITFNKKFIDIIWMDPNYWEWEFRWQQATNWFDFGYNYISINNPAMRSIWLEEGDNFSPSYGSIYANWVFVPWHNKAFIYCTIKNKYWLNNTVGDIIQCSDNNNQVINNVYCDLGSKKCWYPVIQVRLTMWINAPQCTNLNYHPILSFSSWGSPSMFSLKSWPYAKTDFSNISPECLSIGNTHSKLQMRIVNTWYSHVPPQSLLKLFQDWVELKAWFGKFGVINVR